MESEYQEWADKYKPIINHLSSDSECTMFETYGKEKEFVHSHHASQVWTLVEAEGNLYLCQGFHHVNRLAYYIASVPFIDGNKDEYLDTYNESDWEKEYRALEEKYYPITWEINHGQLEIRCKDGKLLPSDHKIYSIEESFIQDQISDYAYYSGEICSI